MLSETWIITKYSSVIELFLRCLSVLGGTLLLPDSMIFLLFIRLTYEQIQRFFQASNRRLGFASCGGILDAVLYAVLQHHPADLIKGCPNGSYLRQHLVALTAFVPETLKTGRVPGYSCKPLGDFLADRFIPMRHEFVLSFYPPGG